MSITDHPINQRWPAQNPDVLQLYSLPTPNGVKVSIALEELGLPYEVHKINFGQDDQFTPEYLALNPNNKIPAILDPNGPGGQPMALFESGAILLYLAEKAGRLMPTTGAARWQALQWLMWQMGGVGPMFGQFGFFNTFGGKGYDDKRPYERYRAETVRLLGVLDQHLAGRDWICADYSMVDIAVGPWVRSLHTTHDARGITGWDTLKHVPGWLDRFLDRPAVERGLTIPG